MLRVDGGEPLAVGMGEAALAGPDGVLAAYGIGSCVVLALWDRVRRWGALCHIVLPGPRAAGGATGGAGNGVGRGAGNGVGRGVDDAQPARYADEAVAWAVARLREGGSRPADLCAKVCGGARLFALQSSLEVGAANVA
ncbi:MAG: chemotaxis protein CheD, partial [Clostridia bacterium]|nr:chemotaxis protein CheD [Clostridia bacterium]